MGQPTNPMLLRDADQVGYLPTRLTTTHPMLLSHTCQSLPLQDLLALASILPCLTESLIYGPAQSINSNQPSDDRNETRLDSRSTDLIMQPIDTVVTTIPNPHSIRFIPRVLLPPAEL